MLAFNHRVVALFKTRQANVSDNFGLHITNVSLRVLVVRRIISIFDELRFGNPSAETGAFDVDISQVCFEPLGVIRRLRFVTFTYEFFERCFGGARAVFLSGKNRNADANYTKRDCEILFHTCASLLEVCAWTGRLLSTSTRRAGEMVALRGLHRLRGKV